MEKNLESPGVEIARCGGIEKALLVFVNICLHVIAISIKLLPAMGFLGFSRVATLSSVLMCCKFRNDWSLRHAEVIDGMSFMITIRVKLYYSPHSFSNIII